MAPGGEKLPVSRAQVRWSHAVLEGDVKGDKGFAAEVVDKMHGRRLSSLPERSGDGMGAMASNKTKSSARPKGRLSR